MKILLIDDEKIVCDGMRAAMEAIPNIHLTVQTAGSVPEAKMVMRGFVPDLLISDIEMPGLSGLDFVEWVRECYPFIRVLILSGHDDFQYVHQAFKMQVDDYLLKPLDIIQFQKIVLQYYFELASSSHQEEIDRIYESFFPPLEKKDYSLRLQKMIAYIHKNLTNDISLSKLAYVFVCSESFISRLFKRETGVTFLDYVARERLYLAFRILLSDPYRSIENIASDLGYTSDRQFFRVFKEKTGMTPNQFREHYLFQAEGYGDAPESSPQTQ